MPEEPSKTEPHQHIGIDPLAPTRIGSEDSSFKSNQVNGNHQSTQPYADYTDEASPLNASTFIAFEVNGRYRIDQLLGSGSFGAVYLAWDKTLERRVAFKVARRDQFESSDGRQQFIEEARASAKIRHSNIVSVYDTGEDEQGNPYVVLEYIDGATLDVAARQRQFSEVEIAWLCAQISDAIHAAHRLGVVHRDLKPGNILVERDGTPQVADFGLAVTEITQRIRRGEIAGSPVYMSPEQVRGKTQFLDGRTDIWSIGVILYELLTGRLPFHASAVGELYQEILERDPKPPRQINDSISPELERICLKCLGKSVQDRYPTASDLANDLRNFSASDSISPAVKSKSWIRRLTYVALSMAGVAVLLFGCYYALIVSNKPTENIPPDLGDSVLAESTPAERDHTTEPSTPKDPEPVPGEWFPLLARDPKPVQWPFSSDYSKWDIDKHRRELWLQCSRTGLMNLGSVDTDTFEFRMDLYQSPWNGSVGVYLGKHVIQVDGEDVEVFQLFELECIKSATSQRNALNHRFLKMKNGKLISRTTPRNVFLGPLNPTEDYSLHISIQNGKIGFIKWNKLRLEKFEEEIAEAALKEFRFEGAFGIYLERASAVVRQAELFQPIKGNNE